ASASLAPAGASIRWRRSLRPAGGTPRTSARSKPSRSRRSPWPNGGRRRSGSSSRSSPRAREWRGTPLCPRPWRRPCTWRRWPRSDRAFDVGPRAVNRLALQRELAQGRELGIIEAELVHLRCWHLLLEGAPGWERADRDALAPDLPLQHLAGAVEAELVRDD